MSEEPESDDWDYIETLIVMCRIEGCGWEGHASWHGIPPAEAYRIHWEEVHMEVS